MESDLTILCVTRAEDCVMGLLGSLAESARDLEAECVIIVDGDIVRDVQKVEDHFNAMLLPAKVISIRSLGYIESILDQALEHTSTDYILRIDDDEQISESMFNWLDKRYYRSAPHWKFPRAHIWPPYTPNMQVSEVRCIVNLPLYPDHQTRLSHRTLSGARTTIHSGSPYGGGELAPCLLEHHKFAIKTIEERREIVARYERLQPGAGSDFKVFSVPEDVISPEQIKLVSLEEIECWAAELC